MTIAPLPVPDAIVASVRRKSLWGPSDSVVVSIVMGPLYSAFCSKITRPRSTGSAWNLGSTETSTWVTGEPPDPLARLTLKVHRPETGPLGRFEVSRAFS